MASISGHHAHTYTRFSDRVSSNKLFGQCCIISTTTCFLRRIHSRQDLTGYHSHKVENKLHWQHPNVFQTYALPFLTPTVSPRIESMPIPHKTSRTEFFTNDCVIAVVGPSGASPFASSSRPRSSRRSTQAQSGSTLIVDVLPSSDTSKLKNGLSQLHAMRRIVPKQCRSFRVTNPNECNRVSTPSMNFRSRHPMEWRARSLCKTLLPGAEEVSPYSSSSDSPPSTGAVDGGAKQEESPRAAS
jgi:hypothetical protein